MSAFGGNAWGQGHRSRRPLSRGGRSLFNGKPFTLEVYASGNNLSQGAQITVNGVTKATDGSSRDINNGLGKSYQTFTGAISGGQLQIQVAQGFGGFAVLDGAQLQVLGDYPPVAQDISMGAQSGVPQTVQIIGGKYAPTDPDGDSMTLGSVGQPTHGTATTDGTSVTYTSSNTYTGPDSFTYTVTDILGASTTATVTANVAANGPSFNLVGMDTTSIPGPCRHLSMHV